MVHHAPAMASDVNGASSDPRDVAVFEAQLRKQYAALRATLVRADAHGETRALDTLLETHQLVCSAWRVVLAETQEEVEAGRAAARDAHERASAAQATLDDATRACAQQRERVDSLLHAHATLSAQVDAQWVAWKASYASSSSAHVEAQLHDARERASRAESALEASLAAVESEYRCKLGAHATALEDARMQASRAEQTARAFAQELAAVQAGRGVLASENARLRAACVDADEHAASLSQQLQDAQEEVRRLRHGLRTEAVAHAHIVQLQHARLTGEKTAAVIAARRAPP